MKYLKIKLLILMVVIFSGCASKYDYTIHKPKVRYKPSLAALDKINKGNIGKRYVWAEEGPECYDCSGLTYYTFGTMGIEIPRVAREQFKNGMWVSKNELQKGDLVFFDTSRYYRGRPTHVGIYLGNGKFIQASSAKKRVVISSLNSPYYSRRYLGARRVHSFNSYKKFKPKIQEYRYARESFNSPVAISEYRPTVTQNQFVKRQIDSSTSANYYIFIPTQPNRASKIVTKLKLSGLPSSVIGQGRAVLVGPFASKGEAVQIKNFNPNLLSNGYIKSL